MCGLYSQALKSELSGPEFLGAVAQAMSVDAAIGIYATAVERASLMSTNGSSSSVPFSDGRMKSAAALTMVRKGLEAALPSLLAANPARIAACRLSCHKRVARPWRSCPFQGAKKRFLTAASSFCAESQSRRGTYGHQYRPGAGEAFPAPNLEASWFALCQSLLH